ncbi:hypothetical protein AAE02nite_39760 [Adhaeribacter aerolatus]|uniref:DUF4625 domain-containing protein n=1 Tax=Adhaeribacter aerolatus TaxID=670289 RepID=A0A512B2W1_9BACT|nr:hypothetical protein [Adhaeribacter aerolatus]GEO06312.1 hypothetical protein AAE02nite_39760 [Adhaeribacter aerolatus]
MKYTKFAFVALVAVLTGCEEYFAKKDSEPDGSKPYIAISAPADNSVFSSNQAIKIESVISDKDKVKELEVQVVKLGESATGNGNPNANPNNKGLGIGQGNDNSSKALWSFKDFPVKNPVVIDTAFSAATLPAGEYLLTLNTVDGRTNVGIKEVHFTVK